MHAADWAPINAIRYLVIPLVLAVATLAGALVQGSAVGFATLAASIGFGALGVAIALWYRSLGARREFVLASVARRLGFSKLEESGYLDAAEYVAQRLRHGQAQARELQQLLENMADGVVVLDPDDHVEVINSAAARMLETNQQEACGVTLTRLARDSKLVYLVASARHENTARRAVIRPVHLNLAILAVAIPVAAQPGNQILLILHDVTATEGQRIAQRDLVANISHDLRTPVAAIKSLSEALLAGAGEQADLRSDFLARIDAEADRLIALTEDVIAAAKADALTDRMDWQQFDLAEVVVELKRRLDPLARRGQVDVQLVGSDALVVLADRAKLEVAIANLLLNAIKFTPPGRSVSLAVSAAQGNARVTVNDHGIGIDPTIHERIFERFFKGDPTRASAGSGLGLTIARRMAQLHDGQVNVTSPGVGAGAEFELSFPLRSQPPPPATALLDDPLNRN